MPRVLSQHGNVIATDFRPRSQIDLAIALETETLYCDGAVTLLRTSALLGDRVILVTHFLGDLATGTIVQLTNG